MRARTWLGFSLTAALAAFAACGSITDIETDLTPENLSGDWEATTVQITNILNPAQSIDLLADGGSLEFRFTIDGDASIFVTSPDGETTTDTGTYVIDPPFLYFLDPGETIEDGEAWSYTLQTTQTGNSLTLATAAVPFDFNGDGTPEPALWAVIIIR